MCSVLRYFFPLLYQYSCQSYMYRSTSILTLLLLSSSIYFRAMFNNQYDWQTEFWKNRWQECWFSSDLSTVFLTICGKFFEGIGFWIWSQHIYSCFLTICGKILEGIGFWISSQYIYIFQVCGNLNMGDSNHQIIYWDPRLTLSYHVQS